MADIPCCEPCVTCDNPPAGTRLVGGPNDPLNPFVNISSAAPDRQLFIGSHYIPPGQPPIGGIFYAAACKTYCISAVSQADADACAQRLNVNCISQNWPTPLPPPPPTPGGGGGGNPSPTPQPPGPRPVFFNSAQSCSSFCEDGTQFMYTVPAGTFSGLSQAAANELALISACQGAAARQICIGEVDIPAQCLGANTNTIIPVSNVSGVFSVEIIDGSLPPGLSLSVVPSGALVSGVTTSTGHYSFTLKANDPSGSFSTRAFTIPVVTVTPTSLPAGQIGTAYSQAMSLVGAIIPPTWSASNLPTGLEIDSGSGVISGTPLGPAASNLVTVSANYFGATCSVDVTITINAAGNQPNFALMEWTTDSEFEYNGGTCSITPDNAPGNPFVANATATHPIPAFDTSESQVDAHAHLETVMPWTGNCNLHLDIVNTAPKPNWMNVEVLLSVDGNPIANYHWIPAMVTSVDYPFNVTGATSIDVVVICAAINSWVDEQGVPVQITVTGTFSNT